MSMKFWRVHSDVDLQVFMLIRKLDCLGVTVGRNDDNGIG